MTVDYSTPQRMGQEGLMTGLALGDRMRERSNSRQLGGLMASGDVAGARAAAYTQGDLRTGQALDGQIQQQADTARQGQIVGALQSGDFGAASSLAGTPQELAQIDQFKSRASEAEVAQAAQQFGTIAMAIESVQGLPPEQQGQAAQAAAQQLGLDPATLPPETWTPQGLERARMQALGYADYLKFKKDEREASMPRYVPALGGFIVPPGSSLPGQGGAQPQTLGSSLPPGWTPQPRPNQAPSASAAGGAERNQPVSVSFQSPDQARQAIASVVPGVRFTSGTRDAATNRRVGGVPSSNHLRGRAWDLVPPTGMTMAELASKMRQQGFRALDEGDHIHVSW